MRVGHTFDWKSAPLSDFQFAIAVALLYVLLVLVHYSSVTVQMSMTIPNTKAFVSLHNIVLMVASLVMFSGCLYEVIYRSIEESSITWLFCENKETTSQGSLWFYVYLYYLSKFYELLDTVLQMFS
eukprot:gene22700-29394_t